MHSDHSESDSSMKIRLYRRLISLVLFWTASFPAMFKVTLHWVKSSCVACDILYFILRDTRTFQLLHDGFSCTMVGQILLGTQILQRWVLFHVFGVYGVLSHWGFLVPNAWNWLVDDSEVKRTAFFHFAWSLPQIPFEQHDGTPPFLIACGKHFGGD